jgi:hypothetical protein
MYQPRILTRREGLLRHATGATNLVLAPGEWYALSPRYRSERYRVSALAFTVAGEGLLAGLNSFGGALATLEVAVDVADGLGGTRDMASTTACLIDSAKDWRGAHASTFVDREAGRYPHGGERAGLRGLPAAGGPPAAPGTWTSDAIDLRYGTDVVACSWETNLLRDASGDVVAPPTIEMRVGSYTDVMAGAVTWSAYTAVANTAAVLEEGRVDLGAALSGDVLQWRVTLPYADPGVASPDADSVARTATLYMLAAWIRMASTRWRFDNVAQLIERSEIGRYAAVGGWDGTDDVLLARIPLEATLRGGRSDALRARLVGDPSLSLLEAQAVVDLGHELAEE